MLEEARLESVYTPKGFPGFESPSLRKDFPASRGRNLAYKRGLQPKICTGCLWQTVGIRGDAKQAASESPWRVASRGGKLAYIPFSPQRMKKHINN